MADLHKETFPYTKNMHEENVIIKRLDDFIQEQGIKLKYDLMIKLDVQSYEDRVLKGGMHTVENAKILICFVSKLSYLWQRLCIQDVEHVQHLVYKVAAIDSLICL